MKVLGLAALASSLAGAAWALGAPVVSAGAAVSVERTAYLMGTRATLATRAGSRPQGLRTLAGMLEQLEAVEAALSTWRAESSLSALNRQPVGVPMPAPPALCRLLAELTEWREATGGAFDPAVGRLVAAWDLRGEGRRPSPETLERARRDTGLEHLELRRAPCRARRTRDVLLDAGAFGKGAALERVAEELAGPAEPPWLIDLGGQIAVGGPARAPWPVALAHPRRRDEAALRLDLSEGSLATSGGSERDLHPDGTTLGHVLDPRTGTPVSRAGSVTVWHRRALAADVLSTALYVMGPEAGLEWAEARGIAACFLEPDAARPGAVSVRATTAFGERFPEATSAAPPGRFGLTPG